MTEGRTRGDIVRRSGAGGTGITCDLSSRLKKLDTILILYHL
jgi:hypothetical protein